MQVQSVEKNPRAVLVSMLPVGKPAADTHAANVTAYAQKGEALAESILKDNEKQALKGKRFLRAIFELTPEGRSALRRVFKESLSDARDEARQAEGTPMADLLASRVNSMAAQTSSYSRFSQACDAGFEPSEWDADFHAILAEARAFLNSGAALAEGKTGDDVAFVKHDAEGNPIAPVGPTRLRGRPSKSKLEKLAGYLEKLEPSLADLEEFAAFLRRSIKAIKDANAADALAEREGKESTKPAHVPLNEEAAQMAA